MPLTFGSLFTGFGGLDLGLERAGLQCKWQVEINPYARSVLQKRWPDVPRFSDATKFCRRIYDCIPAEDEYDDEIWCPRCDAEFGECDCIGTDQLTDDCGFVDIIVDGDPCQENSNARRNGDTTEPSLGAEFIRILGELRPSMFLRENPSTVRKDAPWPWWRIRSAAEQLGYAVLPFRLRACCVGADHRRDRLFLLGELQDANQARLEGDVGQVVERERDGRQDTDIARPDRRRPTPRVCGRPHGIPNRMERLVGLGNAVDVGVAEWIGRQIVESLKQ